MGSTTSLSRRLSAGVPAGQLRRLSRRAPVAASEIYRLHKDKTATPASGEFAQGILGNVVGFAVTAAARARATEDPQT
jgi:hypothetical protein